MNYMAIARRARAPETIIRAPRDSFLSTDQLRTSVPAIFADHAHESRSDRYAFLPTINVVEALADAGFGCVEARQARSREDGRRSFAKHMLRFRHTTGELRLKSTVAEIVMLNAHDGSARYKLMSGLFELICLNGMVIPAGPTAEISVVHSGRIIDDVIEGSKVVLDNAVKALEKPKQWREIELTPQQRHAFASGARVIRFGDAEGHVDTPVRADQLLYARRAEQSGHDLWSTFQVVQENVIRGGLNYTLPNNVRAPHGRRSNVRHLHTRAVSGINDDVRLNRALWVLAENLAEKIAA